MRRLHSFCLAVLAMTLCWTSSARGQLPREIVSQYRPALEKLRQAYTHASFSGTSTLILPKAGKTRTQQFVFRASGQKRRLEATTTAQKGMGLQVGAKQLQLASPDGSLSTYTNPDSKFFDDARETSYGDTVSQIDNGCLLNYPYALDSGGTILDTLLKPGVKVTSVKKIDSQGESLVYISFEETTRNAGHAGLWKTRLVISPAEGWALRGFTRTMGQGANQVTQRAKLTYSGVQDGIPLVQSIESETTEGKTAVKREAIEITDARLGDPDEYYFTSFAF